MFKITAAWQFYIPFLITSVGLPIPAFAQVTPDGTLSTTVTQSGNNFTIINGNQVGSNLFHSFSQFSVPTGGSAYFNNSAAIQTIFARVTSGNISNIDGLIRANGTASLFLMNPAGILFGPNASLNLGGSFTATTANSILFADGVQFSAINPTSNPLLTVSVPVGLQMGANAGSIRAQGSQVQNFFFPSGLLVQPGKTLALVGSELDLAQATLSAPDGRVELWALQNGTVNLPSSGNWQLDSSSTSPTWGTVTLRQASYIDASGANGGAINVRGRGLTMQDGSLMISATGANGRGQGIHVQTTEFVDFLGGFNPLTFAPSGLMTSVAGSGATAGDITIATQQLRILNGAWVQSLNFGADFFTFAPINNARTGKITVRATDVEVSGYSSTPNPFTGIYISSAITTLVTGGQQNDSGAITVNAERVRLLDGGRISTDLLGSINFFTGQPQITTGKAGDIAVTATESLEIRGTDPGNFTSAVISSIQNLAHGQSGNIAIVAGQLSLSDGGTVSSAISGSSSPMMAGRGTAGNITIQAAEVQVSNPIVDFYSQTPSGITVALGQNATGQGGTINLNADRLRVFNGGQITSSSEGNGSAGNVNLNANFIDVQGLSPTLVNGQYLPSAITASATSAFAAGSVNINADLLQVRDRATITVSNAGTGDAGNLNVVARNIFLDNGASLRAEVNGGDQGNIRLQVSDILLLRRGSSITTNAQGASTGGNIDINARFVVADARENSDIVANAVLGSGGNIRITTQGIFGLKFRNQLTPKSDITASSQFGVSGNVQINTINTDPGSGLQALPADVVDSSQQIVAGCGGSQGNSFVVTGRGGVPQNPTQQVMGDRTWEDVRDLSTYRTSNQPVMAHTETDSPVLIQASTWKRHPDGTVELMAEPSAVVPTFAICSGVSAPTASDNSSVSIFTERP